MSQDKEKEIQQVLRKFVIITPIAIMVLLGILEANKSLEDDSSKVLEETKKEITLTSQKPGKYLICLLNSNKNLRL